MAGAHETAEKAEHALHISATNKRIALLISVFALLLAFSETLGKSSQTAGLSYNVEASNLWAFFQAKTVRMTAVRTAAEALEIELAGVTDPARRAALEKRIESWKQTGARYDSEPETQEGRKELAVRAKQSEDKRDLALSRYHHYEIASAAFQIAIVLASATVITGMMLLTWIAGGLGAFGLLMMALGFWAPNLLHALHLF